MDRRTYLSGLALLTAATAGCTGASAPPGDDETPTDGSPTPGSSPTTEPPQSKTPTGPHLAGHEFAETGDCSNPDSATVRFRADSNAVVVEGCISGPNGCAVARLKDATYDRKADTLRVVVESVVEREKDQACTEAIVYLGYRVDATFEGGLPERVEVVHETMSTSRTVATKTRS